MQHSMWLPKQVNKLPSASGACFYVLILVLTYHLKVVFRPVEFCLLIVPNLCYNLLVKEKQSQLVVSSALMFVLICYIQFVHVTCYAMSRLLIKHWHSTAGNPCLCVTCNITFSVWPFSLPRHVPLIAGVHLRVWPYGQFSHVGSSVMWAIQTCSQFSHVSCFSHCWVIWLPLAA